MHDRTLVQMAYCNADPKQLFTLTSGYIFLDLLNVRAAMMFRKEKPLRTTISDQFSKSVGYFESGRDSK